MCEGLGRVLTIRAPLSAHPRPRLNYVAGPLALAPHFTDDRATQSYIRNAPNTFLMMAVPAPTGSLRIFFSSSATIR